MNPLTPLKSIATFVLSIRVLLIATAQPTSANLIAARIGRPKTMNPLIQLKQTTSVFLIGFGLAWVGLSPAVQALSPAPDGGYPNFTTAEGQNALSSLTSGASNTAVGAFSLSSDTTASNNTGVGVRGTHSEQRDRKHCNWECSAFA